MKHRAEARAMSIFEYDQERHMQQEREAGIEKGRRIGLLRKAGVSGLPFMVRTIQDKRVEV